MVEPEGGTDPPVPGKEDIPTFDEWKKKVMEVEEKKSKRIFSSFFYFCTSVYPCIDTL